MLDSEYLKQAKTYQLSKIYNILNQDEKISYISSLLEIAGNYKYNDFHYSFLQFLENHNLPKENLLEIIEKLKYNE